MFQTLVAKLKGIKGDIREMKIVLKPDTRIVKHIPYRLNPRINEKVKKEIDNILEAGLIFSVDKEEWVSPILIHNKKDAMEIRVCIDYHNLNNAYVHDPLPTPFSDEVLENVTGNEAYSFTSGFSRYHQVWIVKEEKKKTTFSMEWGLNEYHVLPFGLNNVPTLFSQIVIAAFRDYIDQFLKVYMYDWRVYSLLRKHTNLLRVMFDRCRHSDVSLSLKKCIFSVLFGTLLV